MRSLSVAILTYNEEANIIVCLKSIYDIADEIVIVDGTSTDKTVDFVKKFDEKKKCKIFIEKNPPNFLENKQKAIKRCTKDWILQLDADEIVSKELREEIVEVLKTQNSNVKHQNHNSKLKISQTKDTGYQISDTKESNYVAFFIPRLNHFLGQPLHKGGQYPDYVLRLFKNGVGKIPLETVHDQIEILPECKNGSVRHLTNPLLHYPYPTFEIYLRKWIQYSIFEAETMYIDKKKPTLFMAIWYLKVLPLYWFLKVYFRHRGILDGWEGLIFHLFSAIRYWIIYAKLLELNSSKTTTKSE